MGNQIKLEIAKPSALESGLKPGDKVILYEKQHIAVVDEHGVIFVVYATDLKGVSKDD